MTAEINVKVEGTIVFETPYGNKCQECIHARRFICDSLEDIGKMHASKRMEKPQIEIHCRPDETDFRRVMNVYYGDFPVRTKRLATVVDCPFEKTMKLE